MSKPRTKLLKEINELIKIQCSSGTWDANAYLHGMANGMILIAALVNDEEPEFLDAPKIFSDELEILDKFNESSIIVDNNETR